MEKDEMRKIHCLERLKLKQDIPMKKGEEYSAGVIIPETTEDTGVTKWIVKTLFKGDIYVTTNQDSAEIIANQEMIKGMLIKLLEKMEGL